MVSYWKRAPLLWCRPGETEAARHLKQFGKTGTINACVPVRRRMQVYAKYKRHYLVEPSGPPSEMEGETKPPLFR